MPWPAANSVWISPQTRATRLRVMLNNAPPMIHSPIATAQGSAAAASNLTPKRFIKVPSALSTET